MPTSGVIAFELGNRPGAALTLALLVLFFGGIGWAIRGLVRRWGGASSIGWGLALVLTLPLAAGMYMSSLGGFYGVVRGDSGWMLDSLWPGQTRHVAVADLRAAQAVPAFKHRWRLRLTLASGETIDSALTDETSARRAAQALQPR